MDEKDRHRPEARKREGARRLRTGQARRRRGRDDPGGAEVGRGGAARPHARAQEEGEGTAPVPQSPTPTRMAFDCRRFADIAVALGLVRREQVEAALGLQESLQRRGISRPIGEVLVESGQLSRGDVLAVLEEWDRQERTEPDPRLRQAG